MSAFTATGGRHDFDRLTEWKKCLDCRIDHGFLACVDYYWLTHARIRDGTLSTQIATKMQRELFEAVLFFGTLKEALERLIVSLYFPSKL
jgi:hypothetical protein